MYLSGMWIIAAVVIFFTSFYIITKRRRHAFKKTAMKVEGIVVEVTEAAATRNNGPGGIIYSPVVKFTTADGRKITGRPLTGFVSQGEVQTPFKTTVYYNPKKPGKFYIEL